MTLCYCTQHNTSDTRTHNMHTHTQTKQKPSPANFRTTIAHLTATTSLMGDTLPVHADGGTGTYNKMW